MGWREGLRLAGRGSGPFKAKGTPKRARRTARPTRALSTHVGQPRPDGSPYWAYRGMGNHYGPAVCPKCGRAGGDYRRTVAAPSLSRSRWHYTPGDPVIPVEYVHVCREPEKPQPKHTRKRPRDRRYVNGGAAR